jgi:hypothetical protein
MKRRYPTIQAGRNWQTREGRKVGRRRLGTKGTRVVRVRGTAAGGTKLEVL